MSDEQIIEALATKVMGWTVGGPIDCRDVQWNPLVNPEHSKQVREKLAERFNWILGYGKTRADEPPFGFALYRSNLDDPDFAAESDTEERAVALCALKSVGGNPNV